MDNAFFNFRIIHARRRLPGDQNEIGPRFHPVAVVPDNFFDHPPQPVPGYRISDFFAHRDSEPKMLNPGLWHIIDDKLKVRHRFSITVNFLEIFSFCQPVLSLHGSSPYLWSKFQTDSVSALTDRPPNKRPKDSSPVLLHSIKGRKKDHPEVVLCPSPSGDVSQSRGFPSIQMKEWIMHSELFFPFSGGRPKPCVRSSCSFSCGNHAPCCAC